MNDENGNNIFNEPNNLNEMAIGMHETFLSFKNAGFTDEQAMQIVLETLRVGMMIQNGDES